MRENKYITNPICFNNYTTFLRVTTLIIIHKQFIVVILHKYIEIMEIDFWELFLETINRYQRVEHNGTSRIFQLDLVPRLYNFKVRDFEYITHKQIIPRIYINNVV